MASPKPTIAIIPGAWHTPSHVSDFITLLQSSGYPTASHKLASVGISNPSEAEHATAAADANDIKHNFLLPLLNQGKDVVLMAHSYSAMPSSAAALGISKKERAERGEPGGVIGMVLVAAFVAAEGQSVEGSMPGQKLSDWVKTIPNTFNTTPEDPTNVFTSATSPAIASRAASLLETSSLISLRSPSPAPAWASSAYDGRRAYVRCGADVCIPTVAQTGMVEASGVAWRVFDLEGADHLPWLMHGEEMREILDELVQEWV